MQWPVCVCVIYLSLCLSQGFGADVPGAPRGDVPQPERGPVPAHAHPQQVSDPPASEGEPQG